MEEMTVEAEYRQELHTIEELAEKLDVESWIVAGLKAANGWGQGRVMTEEDFIQAKTNWLSGPMSKGAK